MTHTRKNTLGMTHTTLIEPRGEWKWHTHLHTHAGMLLEERNDTHTQEYSRNDAHHPDSTHAGML